MMILSALLLTLTASPQLRLPHDVEPVFQAIELRLDPRETTYSGSTRIELQVKKPSAAFRFHAQEMKLEQLVLLLGEKNIPVKFEPGDHNTIVVAPEKQLAPGKYVLKIKFANEYDT